MRDGGGVVWISNVSEAGNANLNACNATDFRSSARRKFVKMDRVMKRRI